MTKQFGPGGSRRGRTKASTFIGLVLPILLVLAGPSRALAEDGSLASEARDPTSPLLAFQLRYDLVADFHKLSDDTQGTFMLQPVFPFKTGPLSHVARLTFPFVTHSPSVRSDSDDIAPGLPSTTIRARGKSGLSDIALLDVIIFPVEAGRLGIGPVMSLPTATNSDLGSQKWTLGPAAVAMLKAGSIQYGGLFQGFFSFAGNKNRDEVSRIAMQPFLNYPLPNDWGVGASEMSFVYDLRRGRAASIPLGIKVDKLVTLGTQPIRLAFEAEYNFRDTEIAPAWTLRFVFTPLFPLGGGS